MINSDSSAAASLEEPLIRVVVPLDVGLIVHSEVLGRSFPINSSVGIARIIMPTIEDTARTSGGYPPVTAPTGFEKIRADMLPGVVGWAMWTSRKESPPVGHVIVEAFAFEISLLSIGIGITEAQLSAGYVKGVDPIIDELKGWAKRLCMWTQLIANQPLDLSDPAPGIISPPSRRSLSWVTSAEVTSWVDSSPGTIDIMIETKLTPLSERLIDAPTMTRLVNLANKPAETPPAVVNFLGAARLAAQRGRLRQALAELGTGLEALLTNMLSLSANHRLTLTPLVKKAIAEGVSLPEDINSALVQPRNRAVHQGVEPDRPLVMRAITIVDNLVRTYHPEFSCPEDLERAHRPHREDLQIIQPPGTES